MMHCAGPDDTQEQSGGERLWASIGFADGVPAADFALGEAAAVAIYTDRGKPFQIISKLAIRMQSWLNYVLVF